MSSRGAGNGGGGVSTTGFARSPKNAPLAANVMKTIPIAAQSTPRRGFFSIALAGGVTGAAPFTTYIAVLVTMWVSPSRADPVIVV